MIFVVDVHVHIFSIIFYCIFHVWDFLNLFIWVEFSLLIYFNTKSFRSTETLKTVFLHTFYMYGVRIQNATNDRQSVGEDSEAYHNTRCACVVCDLL